MFANEVFRSGYNLGFLGVKDPILETEFEPRLVEKVKQFLWELGKGYLYRQPVCARIQRKAEQR